MNCILNVGPVAVGLWITFDRGNLIGFTEDHMSNRVTGKNGIIWWFHLAVFKLSIGWLP